MFSTASRHIAALLMEGRKKISVILSSIEATRDFPVDCWCTCNGMDEVALLAAPIFNFC